MTERILTYDDFRTAEARGEARATHFDVVVIGSGAGGASAAAELAEAGFEVAMVEEGPLIRSHELTADFTDMITRVMRDAGATAILGRAPIQYLEGRCVGGSTLVNGGMCWRTPDKILHRWGMESGLRDLNARALEPLFERVEDRIQAREQDPGTEGGNNLLFERGCRELGFEVQRNKRNQVHCVGTNVCAAGCPTGAKQSTLYSYVPHLFRHGGTLITGCRARRVLTKGGRVSGVAVELHNPETGRFDRKVTLGARIVIVAGGATQSPLLLMRSRLANSSGQLGRNFAIHPHIKVGAVFDEPVDSLRGVHQAFQCTEFHEEGILIAPGGVPFAPLSLVFEKFGAASAEAMAKWKYVATGGVLVDDFATGRVKLGPFGIPVLRYDITDADQSKFVRGVSLLAEIYFAAGAREVLLPFRGYGSIRHPSELQALYDRPPRVQDSEYFTAHIMGTCRMHSNSKLGVVDEWNETYDVENLYVSDASSLPGTLGVNPMETIMALSTRMARGIAERTRPMRMAA